MPCDPHSEGRRMMENQLGVLWKQMSRRRPPRGMKRTRLAVEGPLVSGCHFGECLMFVIACEAHYEPILQTRKVRLRKLR